MEGSKVTGESTSTMMGKSPISTARSSDTVSFVLTGKFGDQSEVELKGKISGNEVQIHFRDGRW
jgi:hypothetical protein